MENIEVLKLVKRKHNDSYRPVLDLSLANDIKNYSGWGNSNLLYELVTALINSDKLNLLRNNEKKISYWYGAAEIIDNKILIEGFKFKFEMPIDKFFKFYDEYNRLIKEKAHEIILRKSGDKITTEGIWYKNDSPFNKKAERNIFKLSKDPKWSSFMPMYVGKCLNLIIDKDDYGGDLDSIYQVITNFCSGIDIGLRDYGTKEFAINYWHYIKANSDKLVGKDVFCAEDGYSIEFKANNKIFVQGHDWSKDEYFDLLEIDLDTFYEVYIQYLELKEQDPLPDEILFIRENGKIRVEGIWYKYEENKKEQNLH